MTSDNFCWSLELTELLQGKALKESGFTALGGQVFSVDIHVNTVPNYSKQLHVHAWLSALYSYSPFTVHQYASISCGRRRYWFSSQKNTPKYSKGKNSDFVWPIFAGWCVINVLFSLIIFNITSNMPRDGHQNAGLVQGCAPVVAPDA